MQAPDFKVNWQQVKDRINDKTRMIVVNTPHNPTGTIWSKQDWLELIELIQDKNIVVLSDEVYEHLVLMVSNTLARCISLSSENVVL